MAIYPEIRDLQLLLALSQRKHFTRAAEDCGISQPAFSARIRQLEDELGVPIVRRGNKFLGFTRDGERVLQWASKILHDAEGLRQDMEIAKGAIRGELVVGVVPTALSYVALIAGELRISYPELVIQIQSLTSAQIARGLADYSIDAGVSYEDEGDHPHIRFDPVYREHYLLLSPASMAPRQAGKASWREAAELPLCLLSKDMHFRQIVDNAFNKAGVQPRPVMQTNAFTAALAQVGNGAAATIAPAKLVGSLLLGPDTVQLTLYEPHVEHQVGLATLIQDPELPAIDALRNAVHKHST